MIYSLTLASVVLSLILWRMLRRSDDKKSIEHATTSGALEFFAIFSLVGVLYSGLQLWINSSTFDPSDFVTVRQMEANIVSIRHTLLPILDLNQRTVVALIVLLVILGAISPRLGRLRLVPKTKAILRWLRRGHVFLTVLASFTFFGSAAAATSHQRTAQIKAKIEEVQIGYQHYEAKLERIARRIIVRSLSKSTGFSHPVREYDKYVQSKARAIERARTRPHAELTTLPLEAEKYDRRYGGEFNDLKDKVKQEERRVDSGLSSSLAFPSIEDGTAALAKYLNAEADTALASTDEESDGLLAVVEETATLLHEETSKEAIERLVAAASDALGENELVKLLYEPFLQTPVEELVKKVAGKLFDGTKQTPSMLSRLVAAAGEMCDREIGNDTSDPDTARVTRAVQSLAAASTQMAKFAAAADNEVKRKAGTDSTDEVKRRAGMESADEVKRNAEMEAATRLGEVVQKWKRLYAFPTLKILQRASDADLAAFRSKVRNTADASARLQLINTIDGFIDAYSLETLEEYMLSSHRFRNAVDAAIKPVLAQDNIGRWGSIRKRIVDEDWSHETGDPVTNIVLERVAERFVHWRREKAYHSLLERAGAVDENDWERDFSRFTFRDGEAAALFGWVVRGRYEEQISSKYHGVLTPVTGYPYYAAETKLLSDSDVYYVIYIKPETRPFLEGVCGNLK